ncbi:hypothetical protein EBZ80_20040 [bacterium]|nr:hypothetical protein [bacterium]
MVLLQLFPQFPDELPFVWLSHKFPNHPSLHPVPVNEALLEKKGELFVHDVPWKLPLQLPL